MIGAASRLFRLYHVERAVHTELGLVDEALMVLCRDASGGKLAWLETRDDFMRVFHRALRSAITHLRDSGVRSKRGGDGGHERGRNARPDSSTEGDHASNSGFRREEMDLDQLRSRAPDPSRGR
jgi:hypothetical protein